MTASEPLVRRARALLIAFGASGLTAYNFLTRTIATLDDLALALLRATDDWQPRSRTIDEVSHRYPRREVAKCFNRLADRSCLVVRGTRAAARDADYESRWAWGPEAGLYHFSIRNLAYMDAQQQADFLARQVATAPCPPLWTTNDGLPTLRLAPPALDSGLLATMRRRRSYRGFSRRPIPLAALRDCLSAGMAITEFGETHLLGALPLSMTPSGGARNPFEAFVCCRAVEGLAPGVYHYSAVDHTLGLVSSAPLPRLGDLLAGQRWFDQAAATILLAAEFERTMWKYPHPTGYRVVLLEAGHIVQNMLLLATEHGLAATPTCAVDDKLVDRTVGIDSVTQAVLYTLSIGTRSAKRSEADLPVVRPNPAFPHRAAGGSGGRRRPSR